jgi:hypothetical protein
MANEISYFGLRPIRHINGSTWNGVTEKCWVGADYNTALYVGQTVMISTDASESHAFARFTSIEASALTDGSPIYGVITSVDTMMDGSASQLYKPAYQDAFLNVCVDPTVVYHIRDDGSAVPDETWPFLNAEMVDAGGSAITGLSGIGLLGTSPAVDQSLTLLIIRRVNLPENALSINALWEVMINTHQLLNGGVIGNALGVAKA